MYFQITLACTMSCEHCCFSCSKNNPNAEHMTMRTLVRALRLTKHLEHAVERKRRTLEQLDEYTDHLEDFDFGISLGGGEPTMHPQFWEIFGRCLEYVGKNDQRLWMKTNGSLRHIAVPLLQMGRDNELFYCELSADQFHEQVNPMVYMAAGLPSNYDPMTIRPGDRHYIGRIADCGSARENGWAGHTVESHSQHISTMENCGLDTPPQCCCEDMLIAPNGDVFICGCDGYHIDVEQPNGETNNEWVDHKPLGNVNEDWTNIVLYVLEHGRGCMRHLPHRE